MPNKNNVPARTPTCHPERKHLARGLCKPCYDAALSTVNRERRNAASRRWAAANKEKRLAIKRRALYGVDHETVAARFKAQDGLCKICLTGPAEHLDHDHATKKARGLLCGHCNRGLGLFRDDSARLLRAAAYLSLWGTGEKVGNSTRGLE